MNLEKIKLCSKCEKKVAEALSISVRKINNGGLVEVHWKLKLAEFTMQQTGIKFKQKDVEGQILRALKSVEKDREVEKLKDENVSLKEKTLELENKVKKLGEKLEEFETKERLVPVKKGDKLERIISDALKRAFPNDDIILERKGKREVDIIDVVRDGKNVVGKINVHCKYTKQWKNEWLNYAKIQEKKINTPYSVIATTSMPNEKWVSPLGLEKENILITTPEKAIWAVAYMRLAILRTYKEVAKLENQRKMFEKQNEIKKKLLQTINTNDFEEVFAACKALKTENQNIRTCISEAKIEVDRRTDRIDILVDLVVRAHTKINDLFNSLVK